MRLKERAEEEETRIESSMFLRDTHLLLLLFFLSPGLLLPLQHGRHRPSPLPQRRHPSRDPRSPPRRHSSRTKSSCRPSNLLSSLRAGTPSSLPSRRTPRILNEGSRLEALEEVVWRRRALDRRREEGGAREDGEGDQARRRGLLRGRG